MRVPGTRRRACSRPRPTARTCGWSIRRSTRSSSPARNPDREVVFFGLGFETTMPTTALTVMRGRRRTASATSRSSATTSPSPPTIKAMLDSPEMVLDGFVGPGHVSMVIGTSALRLHRARLPQAARGRGLRAARHPAVGADGARAAARGPRRGGEPVFPRGAGGRQPRRHRRRRGVFELRRSSSNGAASARSTIRGCRSATAYAAFDAERKFGSATAPDASSRRARGPCQCGEVLKGVHQAAGSARYSAPPAPRRRRSAR